MASAPASVLIPAFVLVSAWVFHLVFGAVSKNFAGPYDLIVKQISDCDDRGTEEFQMIGNKMRKFNRTASLYSAKLIVPRELNDDYKLSVLVAMFGNGGWKSTYSGVDFGGVCSMLHNYAPSLLQRVAGGLLGIPPPYCPVPPGNYTLTNMNLQLDLKLPFVPYGQYRMDCNFLYKGAAKVACKRIFMDSVHKKTQRG